MPVTEMIFGLAAGLFLLTGFIALLRLLGLLIRQATIRRAIDKDPSVVERIGELLSEPKAVPPSDDRTGVILVAVGVAILAASLSVGDTLGWHDYGIGAAMLPLFVGAAMWGRHALVERARRRAAGE